MEECAVFADRPSFLPVAFQEPPEPIEMPTSKWLLTVYGKDIISHLDHINASITSTFGTILKMDSTKKITKKLASHARGTAQWMSSVGNERTDTHQCPDCPGRPWSGLHGVRPGHRQGAEQAADPVWRMA